MPTYTLSQPKTEHERQFRWEQLEKAKVDELQWGLNRRLPPKDIQTLLSVEDAGKLSNSGCTVRLHHFR